MKLKLMLGIIAMLLLGSAFAQTVGTISNLSGTLLVKKSDGTTKSLAQKSSVEQGDLLQSQDKSYARIKFVDESEITLKPNTQFKIDGFAYDKDKPEADNSIFTLVKGGLRSITGLLGKRNHDRYQLKTPTATIGIRGTNYIAEYKSEGDDLAPGLYVQVIEGSILITNDGGKQEYSIGQFGFVPTLTDPPKILPNNPGLKFNPPKSGGKVQSGWLDKPDDTTCK